MAAKARLARSDGDGVLRASCLGELFEGERNTAYLGVYLVPVTGPGTPLLEP